MDNLTMVQMIPKFVEAVAEFSRLHLIINEMEALATDDETQKYLVSGRSYLVCGFAQIMAISLRFSMSTQNMQLWDQVAGVDRSVSTYLADLNGIREKMGLKSIVPEDIGE